MSSADTMRGANAGRPGTLPRAETAPTADAPGQVPGRTIGFTEMKEKYLPHRFPMLMLDRVTDYREGDYVEGIKCVSGNSLEMLGHFPERAILPATFIIQAFAQLGIILLRLSRPLAADEMTVVTTTKFRFLAPVCPGDTLRLRLVATRMGDAIGMFNGEALVDGKTVVRGSLTLARTTVSRVESPFW